MKGHKLKEELQKRTIEPSKGSWELLDKKLTSFETEKKKRNWMPLKVASMILIIVSVGIYFYQPEQSHNDTPLIAAPSSEENLNPLPDQNAVIETEIVEKTEDTSFENSPAADAIKYVAPEEEIAYTQSDLNQKSTENLEDTVILIDTISTEILSAEIAASNDELIDEEIEELLHQAKVKLIVNGQISPKKLVNNDALLNAVENDLDKDFKQKVIEKIVNTLKKDKEVVSSKEN